MSLVEEFILEDNVTMEEVKQRVKSWEVSYEGKDYVRVVKSKRNVELIKSKHDKKVCCYPCIFTFISAFLVVPFLFPLTYANMMAVLVGYMAVVMVCYVGSIGYFCLGTKKTEFHLFFSKDMPIHVTIRREGEIADSSHAYETLKSRIIGHTKKSGPGVLW